MKKIYLDRFSPDRAFFPESVALNGCCHSIHKKPENERGMNFFPEINGYSCQSCDEPYTGVFPGEISFVSALYFPDTHSGHEGFVNYIGARVINCVNEHAAGAIYQAISAGFHVKENFLEGTFYNDAYSSESWLWVLHGATVIVCYAEHSATCPAPGPDGCVVEIRKILFDVVYAMAEYTKYPK